MATEDIDFRLYNSAGTLVDADAVPTLGDDGSAFGIKNADTGTIIIADNTAMTKVSTGHYRYQLTVAAAESAAADTAAYGSTYVVAVEYVYLDNTNYIESNRTMPPAESSRGHAGWACDAVEAYLGGTQAAGVALEYVKAGYDTFLAGMNPDTRMKHAWSFLTRSAELTLPASVEGTASGTYTASVSGRQLGTIAVTATTEIFASTHVNQYLFVDNLGTYKITAYTSTTVVTVQVLIGQTAADFTSQPVHTAGWIDLPTDFDGLPGGLTYLNSDSYTTPRIHQTSVERIWQMWRDYDSDGTVTHFALLPTEFASSTGQRFQLLYAPRADDAQVVRFPYHVRPTELTDSTSVYFLGGRQHYETIKLAALANAELIKTKSIGVMQVAFEKAMIGSIEADELLFQTHGSVSLADESTGIEVW